MKTILFSLMFAAIAFSGCEKCYTCTTTTTTRVNVSTPGYPQTTTTSFEACGDDKDSAEGTTTATSSAGNITATATAVTKCNPK